MPWKAISGILISALLILFITFNMGNVTDISFIFITIRHVPVYLIVFFSLLIGALGMFPVIIHSRRVTKRSSQRQKDEESIDKAFNDTISQIQNLESGKGKRSSKRGKKRSKKLIDDPEVVSDLDIFK